MNEEECERFHQDIKNWNATKEDGITIFLQITAGTYKKTVQTNCKQECPTKEAS